MIVREHYELLQTNKSEIYKIEIRKILWKRQITNTNTFKMLAPYACFCKEHVSIGNFCLVQLLSHVRLFATPWIAACQASLSITNSQSLLKLMSIKSVMPSSHLILCHPLLLLPSIPPIIRVFSSESTLRMRWPRYWSFSLSIIPSKEIPGLISFRMDWLDLVLLPGSIFWDI